MVTIDCSDLPRPRALDYQITRALSFNFTTLLIEEGRFDTKVWEARITRLHRVSRGHWGDHHGPSFCLPPAIDNGAAAIANDSVIPLPGFGINGLSHRTDDSQTLSRVPSNKIVPQRMQCTNGRRRRKEGVDLVFVDNLPATASVGIGGDTFKHYGGSTIC